MSQVEFSKVLSNWIREALSSSGQLPREISIEDWVADRFMNWWGSQASESIESIESTVHAIREEIQNLDGWDRKEFHGIAQELAHLDSYVADLRKVFGLPDTIPD